MLCPSCRYHLYVPIDSTWMYLGINGTALATHCERASSQVAEAELQRISNKVRFITMVVDGRLVLARRKRTDVEGDLSANGFDRLPPKNAPVCSRDCPVALPYQHASNLQQHEHAPNMYTLCSNMYTLCTQRLPFFLCNVSTHTPPGNLLILK